ncbi:Snx2, partial [Symbiodinium sp. KB8]
MKKFKSLFKKDPAKKGAEIRCPGGGSLASTQAEIELYDLYFDVVDTDGHGSIGKEGAIFLNRSNLSKDQLREIWRIASGGVSKPALDRASWHIALKLIAAAQDGKEMDVEALQKDDSIGALPPADVGINNDPIVESDPVEPVSKASIRTTVRDPHLEGSGMSKYTAYVVTTSTSLPQFPRKEMSVSRRYRDFLWLHTRLCIKYPGNVIPRFPVKKMMGNLDSEFVENRRESLETYIDKVVHHPRLNQSFDLRMFLEATQRGFEALKEAVERQAKATGFGSSNVFSAMMKHITAGGGKDIDTSADEGYTLQLRLHMDAMQRLTSAVDASNAFLANIRSCSDTYRQLGSQFGKMAIVEGE